MHKQGQYFPIHKNDVYPKKTTHSKCIATVEIFMWQSLKILALIIVLWPKHLNAENQLKLDSSVTINYFCQDKTESNQLEEIPISELIPLQRHYINLGYRPDLECWTQILIDNQQETAVEVLLEHQEVKTEFLELFQLRADKMESLGQAGSLLPFSERPYSYRLPVFPVVLQPGLNELRAFQYGNDFMVIGWKVYLPSEFRKLVDLENLLLGGFFAICFALALYNLVIFWVNKVISHFYYCLYLSSYAFAQLFLSGMLKQYLAPDSALYNHGLGLATIPFALFWTYLFIYRFLDLQNFPKKYRYPFLGLMYFNLLNIAINLAGFYTFSAYLTLYSSAAASIAVAAIGILSLRYKHPSAGMFIVAWASLIVGNMVQVMASSGVLELNPLTRAANYLGATIEAILLSYALAHNMRREKMIEIARRNHAFKQLEKMVYPHQIDLMKNGQSLESTMPLGKGHACVICFDVMASSRLLPIHGLKEFLRNFFEQCQELMNQNYDMKRLTGDAFRIKELGDGFLCSVGFPFSPPFSTQPTQLAMDLAFHFVELFETAGKQLPLPPEKRPCCSIGIAQGMIEGFFPLSGIRSYELFGRSIILATRYEALRQSLMIPGEGHLITVQESVFKSLNQETKDKFSVFKLDGKKYRIRDDENARRFYYCRIPQSSTETYGELRKLG